MSELEQVIINISPPPYWEQPPSYYLDKEDSENESDTNSSSSSSSIEDGTESEDKLTPDHNVCLTNCLCFNQKYAGYIFYYIFGTIALYFMIVLLLNLNGQLEWPTTIEHMGVFVGLSMVLITGMIIFLYCVTHPEFRIFFFYRCDPFLLLFMLY